MGTSPPGFNLGTIMKTSRMLWYSAILFTLWIFSCDTTGPSEVSPSVTLDPVIIEMWGVAQELLLQELPDIAGDPRSIHPQDWEWKLEDGVFDCGKVHGTPGCISVSSRWIKVWLEQPWAVVVEAKHAILYDLRDPRWRCHEFPENQPCTN